MVKFQKGPQVAAPSSSLGIMRFFDADTAGPKLDPAIVVGFIFVLIVLILGIKLMVPL